MGCLNQRIVFFRFGIFYVVLNLKDFCILKYSIYEWIQIIAF